MTPAGGNRTASSRQRRPTASAFLVLLFLCAWLLPPLWPLATLQAVNVQDDIYASDLWNDRLPARAFVGESLRRGELPLWCPDLYTGFPLLAAIEVGALYPSNVILFALFDPYTAIAWAQLLSLFVAGLGTFCLAREIGLPRPPAFLSAGSFALSGFLVAHLRQLNMVDAACWIPWLFLFGERLLRGPSGRRAAAFAAAWAIQLLAGHPQISYLTGLVLAVWLPVRWRQLDRARGGSPAWPVRFVTGRFLWLLLAAVFAGTALAGAQLVPASELALLSHRRGGFTFEEAAAWSVSPRSLVAFLLPYANGDPGTDSFRLPGIFWEQYGYLGLAPALLAVFAVAVGWRSPLVRLLTALAFLSGLLVLGENTPLFGFAYQVIPGMSHFRFPTRFLVFVELALALLAGIGLARVLGRMRGRWLPALAAAAVLALTAGDLWIHQMRQVPFAPRDRWISPVPTAEFLHAARGGGPAAPRYYSLDPTVVHAAVFHEAGGWARGTEPFERLRLHLQPSFNLLHGLPSPDGYVNLAPRWYEAVWGSDKEPGLVRPSGEAGDEGWRLRPEVGRLLRLFHVGWVVSAWPAISPSLAEPMAVFAEGFGVQEVLEPLPRAFVVGRAIVAESDAEGLAILAGDLFDPAREAIVHEPVSLAAGAASSQDVVVVDRDARRLRLRAKLDQPGLLVVSEGYYPGWTAKVDGREARLLRANLMMRAVSLQAGEHEVVFEYEPWTFRIGVGVSLVGLLALLALARARGSYSADVTSPTRIA